MTTAKPSATTTQQPGLRGRSNQRQEVRWKGTGACDVDPPASAYPRARRDDTFQDPS